MKEIKKKLKEIKAKIAKYKLKKIYNINEINLFYNLALNIIIT